MNNDLNDILDQAELSKRPFKVPDGYFDTLNSRIMQNVMAQASSETEPAAEKPKAKRVMMTPMKWAAACVCALAIGTGVYHFAGSEDGEKQTAEVVTTPQKDTATVIKQAISTATRTVTAKVEEKVEQKATRIATEAAAIQPTKTIAKNTSTKKAEQKATDGEAYEEAAEYAMLDNYEMYDLMTENND